MQAKSNFILPLTDASARLVQVGGKGASLARLAAAGLPVPPGFHITTAAYRRFVSENGIQPRILEALRGLTRMIWPPLGRFLRPLGVSLPRGKSQLRLPRRFLTLTRT